MLPKMLRMVREEEHGMSIYYADGVYARKENWTYVCRMRFVTTFGMDTSEKAHGYPKIEGAKKPGAASRTHRDLR